MVQKYGLMITKIQNHYYSLLVLVFYDLPIYAKNTNKNDKLLIIFMRNDLPISYLFIIYFHAIVIEVFTIKNRKNY